MRSFPQHALVAGNELQDDVYLMSPTCCYPVFHALSDHTMNGRTLYTHKNICFRREGEYHQSVRQGAFLMREYILFAETLDATRDWIEEVKAAVAELLNALDLAHDLQAATDPFFDPNDLRQKFQEAQNLKSEFVVGDLAIASVNLHLQAMSRNCRISGPGGIPLYTACFGLGYDRVAGLLAQRTQAGR